MAKPLFCSENFFNTVQFSGHTVSAEEEPTGNEAFRVGTSRRSSRNFATASTANSDWWVKVACDRVRTASFLAIDRGHNLAGKTIYLEGSNDDFTTKERVVSVTVPSNVFAPSDLRDNPGTKTEEGAYLKRFDDRGYKYWRLYVPAMGSGLKPQIVGLYVGFGWEPEFLLAQPFSFGGRELQFEETQSDTAWVGTSRPAQRYSVEVNLKLQDWEEYDLARLHVETQMWRRRPTWFIPDQARAERSWLGMVPRGTYRFQQARGWGYMQTSFPLVEHEPKLV